MSFSKKQTVGYRYYFDIHMGMGRGPIDELVEIKVSDRSAWTGSVTESTTIVINQPGLFGGDDQEGGIVGTLKILMGGEDQAVDPDLAAALGGIVPAFRGVTTFFYSGQICSNSPYPKPWKMRQRRNLKGWYKDTPWYPEKAVIELAGGSIKAQNGAHIIYECLTNPLWGRGFGSNMIDEATFRKTADTLFNEGFGLCLRWNRQEDIDEFIKRVINHIGGSLFIDRTTGLFTLTLLRKDYNIADLKVYSLSSGLLEVLDDAISTVDSSLNEFILKFRDPIKDELVPVRAQSLAARQAAGVVISDTREYEGIPIYELGSRVAQRELRIQASGVRSIKARFDRSAWKERPGSVLAISLPDRGIDFMVMRVGTYAETGSVEDRSITLDLIQDVFDLGETAFSQEQPSSWTPADPNPYPVTTRWIGEASYRDLVRSMSTSDLNSLDEFSGSVAVMAQRPTSLAPNYDIKTRSGSEDFAFRTQADWTPNGLLMGDISASATTLNFAMAYGAKLLLETKPISCQIDDEIMKVTAFDLVTSEMTVVRGCVDTLPAAHVGGARIWFGDDYVGLVELEYTSGESVDVKLITNAKLGPLADTLAPTEVVNILGRQGRPYPPAKARLNNSYFYSLPNIATPELTFTWQHRNRVSQKDVLVGFIENTTSLEQDTTYELNMVDSVTDVPIRSDVTAMTGTSFTYTADMALADGWHAGVKATLRTKRDGVYNLFPVVFNINRQADGPLYRTTKYYERYSGSPSAAEKKAVFNLVSNLYDDNLWDKIKFLHILMAVSSQGSLVDLINPVIARDFVPINSPTFTTKLGWNGDDATSYLTKSGINYNALGITQNNAHMIAYLSGGPKDSMATFGVSQSPASGARFYLQPHRVGDTFSGAHHAGTGTFTGPVPDAVVEGLVGVNRVDAANISYLKNGAITSTLAHASTGVPVGHVTVGRATSGATVVYSSQRVGMISGGLGLTSTEIADYDNAFDAFLAEWASV